jgi:[ribosomal protein S5]-alanine N-acetyltransferase
MLQLQRVRPDHATALIAFELENRAYFAASIPDRGDDYFTYFSEQHARLLGWQEAGLDHFHVLEGVDGEVLGRVNLTKVVDGCAELGFRVAQKAARQGLATSAVHQVCALARLDYGLTSLRARATLDNLGSRAVLARTGFLPVDEILLNGRPGLSYLRNLSEVPAGDPSL